MAPESVYVSRQIRRPGAGDWGVSRPPRHPLTWSTSNGGVSAATHWRTSTTHNARHQHASYSQCSFASVPRVRGRVIDDQQGFRANSLRRRFANQVAWLSAICVFRPKFLSFRGLSAPADLAGVGSKHVVLARRRDNRGNRTSAAVSVSSYDLRFDRLKS